MGLLVATLATALPLHAQLTIPTNRYDGARTGANLAESKLTAANVNAAQFGKLYSYPVDGSVYAQPLYVSGVTINGAARNVLYVATMNDKVYAFDADSPSPSPLWTRDFTAPPAVVPVPITDIAPPNRNIVGNVGIHSTPVIDPVSRTIYLVARTKENGAYVQRLHALDITTGASRPGSPVVITGAVAGSAADATPGPNGPIVTFNPKMQSQRAALALSNGVVLIGWAAHEDFPPYHGWIMGYDAATLAQVAVFCATPDGYGGGVWQGGRAPTIDAAGNVYFVTGNGPWDGARNFGNSVLKFAVSRAGLTLLDYFTPSNYETLNAHDDDLGGSSFTLLPGSNRLLGGGKEGVLYLLDAASLGGIAADDAQIPQRIDVEGGHVMGGPVFWNSATLGPMVYHWGEDDVLKAYQFGGGLLGLPPYAEGAVLSPGHPGGSLTLSANGSAAGSGIVWSSMPAFQDGIHGLVAGVLRAFDAESLNEIWNSEQNAPRDRAGTLMKFVPPIVVNGKVYMPNHDGAVSVYGLLSPSGPAPAGTISIDFTGANAAGMGASESAGVVSARNWNAAAGSGSSSPQTLVDASGAATSASLTWSAPGIWQLPTTDAPGNARMMKGYLDTSSTTSTTVSIAGLADRTYDVYVYADGDNKTFDRSAAYTIRGTGITTTTLALTDAANTNFSGTFVPAVNGPGNYVHFRVSGTGFTIEATPTAPETGTRRAPINGLQIVPVAGPPPPPPSPAGTISVDFVGGSPAAMSPGEIAGVVAAANWNSAFGASRSDPQSLVDDRGESTAATLTWSAPGTWMLPIADQPGSARMMKGYLDTTSTSAVSLTVEGLAQGSYDVYLYADGDNRANDRGASYTLSGAGDMTVGLLDAANTNFGGTFTRADGSAGNYVRFSITGTRFTIVGQPTSPEGGTRRAPVNGIQIVPTSAPPPEPDVAAIGIDFLGNSPTAMTAAERAGVVPQENWNTAMGAVRSAPLALVDANGAATTASVTWSANGGWSVPISDTAGDFRLMRGYLDTSTSSVTTVTVRGMPVRHYDVYIYADGDNKDYVRSAIYRVTAGGVTSEAALTDPASTNFSGTFTQASGGAGNYVKLTINAGEFTLAAIPSTGSNATLRAPLNAIQIVPR